MMPVLNLGAWRHLNGANGGCALGLPACHLVTHCVVVGMTGSGKTGLALMKQARGFGVGVVVATQNPMDLDYLLATERLSVARHALRQTANAVASLTKLATALAVLVADCDDSADFAQNLYDVSLGFAYDVKPAPNT